MFFTRFRSIQYNPGATVQQLLIALGILRVWDWVSTPDFQVVDGFLAVSRGSHNFVSIKLLNLSIWLPLNLASLTTTPPRVQLGRFGCLDGAPFREMSWFQRGPPRICGVLKGRPPGGKGEDHRTEELALIFRINYIEVFKCI